MEFFIGDGTGLSRGKAGVTSDHKLEICAVTQTMDLYCNQGKGTSFSLLVSQTPVGAGDCFCYVKNNDDNDMVVSSIKLYAASDEVFEVKLGDTGSPVDGSEATPGNRNAGSSNPAEVTAEVGNDITGLSGGNAVDAIPIKGGDSARRYVWLSGLIIPKHHTLTLYVENGGIAVRVTVSAHFCLCE